MSDQDAIRTLASIHFTTTLKTTPDNVGWAKLSNGAFRADATDTCTPFIYLVPYHTLASDTSPLFSRASDVKKRDDDDKKKQ